jgi:hypothetical protein
LLALYARDGVVHVEQRIAGQGTLERAVVTGAFWIFVEHVRS